jgi:hypothetical protein
MSGLNSSAHGSSPYVRVEASATAGAHLAPGAVAPAPGVLSRREPAIVEALRAEYAKGATTRQAAERLNMDVKHALYYRRRYGVKPLDAVEAKARGVRISKPDLTERNARIVALVKQGTPVPKAADIVGVSRSIAFYVAKMAGLSAPPARFTFKPEHDAVILRMRGEGATSVAIAAALGNGITAKQVESRAGYIKREKPHTAVQIEHERGMRIEHADKSKARDRKCLCGCGRMFFSVFPGERIRPECRRTWEERV